MKRKRLFGFFGLVFPFILLVALTGEAQTIDPYQKGKDQKPGTHSPVITRAFATDKGYTGHIWMIYIEAEDPDGDMRKIAAVVEERGYGVYCPDWTLLKTQHGKYFKGYLQWNTPGGLGYYLPEWTLITLKVSVVDKAGNESNEVAFPFTFELTRAQYDYKLPAPFDQGDIPRLGYIATTLYPPGGGGTDTPN